MIYLSGTIVIALLGFASTMVLTRVLSQKVYAMYGLLATFVTAVDMFIAFGYDQAYMRFFYTHDRSSGGFLWECVKVPLMLFLVFAAVFLEPGQHLIKLVFAERLTWIAAGTVLGRVFFSSTHRFGQLTARMSESAGNYVISNIISKSGFIGIILLLSVVIGDVSFEWIGISFTITAAAATAINLAAFKRIAHRRNFDGKQIAGQELIQYGFPYMINNVIILVIPIVEKIIIRDLAGWEILSVFTAASIFQTVVMMVMNTITNIWNPLVYKHCEDERTFKPILHRFGLLAVLVMSFGTTACILLRRWLVLLLDVKYFTVYVIAPTILVTACFNILAAIYAVGIDIRKKTIHLVVAPSKPLAMHDQCTYEKLLHSASIHFLELIELHIILQHQAHCLTQLLLVAISCYAGRLFHLLSVCSDNITHMPTHKVTLERNVALTLDVILLGHLHAIHLDHIFPLVSVCVTLVAVSIDTELRHVIPIPLRLHQDVKCSS